MIVGIGTDLLKIDRIKLDEAFVQRILTEKEKTIFSSFGSKKRQQEFLAGRFAAKEAISKAFGTGIGNIGFHDIEILPDENGQPICHMDGHRVLITISHTDEYALAMCVLES